MRQIRQESVGITAGSIPTKGGKIPRSFLYLRAGGAAALSTYFTFCCDHTAPRGAWFGAQLPMDPLSFHSLFFVLKLIMPSHCPKGTAVM
jgi:hypothetical protein